ncbi:hypothetical protein OsI_37064 [Oryza sativa Indica Group]|uniref:Uncharacterized protein n=1 Tax=Oryza sativa subsp. indica TaxID=39946 RepID=B8BIL0_ORYSI|nr:hypothetical protein OsI_37064 [Oryza sativa Indica Group]
MATRRRRARRRGGLSSLAAALGGLEAVLIVARSDNSSRPHPPSAAAFVGFPHGGAHARRVVRPATAAPEEAIEAPLKRKETASPPPPLDRLVTNKPPGMRFRWELRETSSTVSGSRLSSTCFSTQTSSTASGRVRVARLQGGGRWRGPADGIGNEIGIGKGGEDRLVTNKPPGMRFRWELRETSSTVSGSRLSSTCFSTQTSSTASGRVRVARLQGGGRWRGPADGIGDEIGIGKGGEVQRHAVDDITVGALNAAMHNTTANYLESFFLLSTARAQAASYS